MDYFGISPMSSGLAVQCCDWTVELSGAAAFPPGRIGKLPAPTGPTEQIQQGRCASGKEIANSMKIAYLLISSHIQWFQCNY